MSELDRLEMQDAIVAVMLEAYQAGETSSTAAGFEEAGAFTGTGLMGSSLLNVWGHPRRGWQ